MIKKLGGIIIIIIACVSVFPISLGLLALLFNLFCGISRFCDFFIKDFVI
jgi:hypothetical protein